MRQGGSGLAERLITQVSDSVIHHYWCFVFPLTDSFGAAVRWKRMWCGNWSNSLPTALNLATHFSDRSLLASLSCIPGTCSGFLWPRAGVSHGWGGRKSSTQGMPSFNYLARATVMGNVRAAFLTLAQGLLLHVCSPRYAKRFGLVPKCHCRVWWMRHNFRLGSFFSLSYLFYQVGN